MLSRSQEGGTVGLDEGDRERNDWAGPEAYWRAY